MKSKTRERLGSAVAGLMVALLYLMDTGPYVAANSDLEHIRKSDGFLRTWSDGDIDRLRASLCEIKSDPKEMRQCLLTTMADVRSPLGAIAFSSLASSWLLAVHEDQALRATALAMVERAETTSRALTLYYALIDRRNLAHNSSLLLRMKDGTWEQTSTKEVLDMELKQARLNVLDPKPRKNYEPPPLI